MPIERPVSDVGSLPAWFDKSRATPLNYDMTERVVIPAKAAEWAPTTRPGIDMQVLEFIDGPSPRLSAWLELTADYAAVSLGPGANQEMLVIHGSLRAGSERWPSGHYVRLPARGEKRVDQLSLERHADTGKDTPGRALAYVASGHIPASDTERRIIDTTDESRWLPGPVTGTEVLPLHGHGSSNVMLIRWLAAVAFQPRLDPLGEEVMVISGCLHDAMGSYPAGSWIRNPVPAWQSWAGDAGTIVYYKSGHFAIAPDQDPSVHDGES